MIGSGKVSNSENRVVQASPQMASYAAKEHMSSRYIGTEAAYDLWASTYDHDGNFLQAIDSEEMETLIPHLFDSLELVPHQALKIVDLGCGTGRNTLLLQRYIITHVKSSSTKTVIVGLDLSKGMLEVARSRVSADVKTELNVYNMLQPDISPLPAAATGADAIVSTLVIEHVPVPVFFDSVVQILKPGGMLLLTNMHSDMGSLTQAGFLDPVTGERVRGESYAHSLEDVVKGAHDAGFEVIRTPKETAIDEERVKSLSDRARKYVGVYAWFAVMLRRCKA